MYFLLRLADLKDFIKYLIQVLPSVLPILLFYAEEIIIGVEGSEVQN